MNEDTQQLIRDLKDQFAVEYEKRVGRPYKGNKRSDTQEHWLKTAQLVQQLKADPITFIKAQFYYTKGTVFVNALHGNYAKKTYEKYYYSNVGIMPKPEDVKSSMLPGKIDLLRRFEHTMFLLQKYAGTEDVTDIRAVSYILDHPWMFDAVGVLLLADNEIPEFFPVFLADAYQVLSSNRQLCEAARDLDYDPDSILTKDDTKI